MLRYYHIEIQDAHNGRVRSLARQGPYAAALRQVSETALWFEPIYIFLGADDTSMKMIENSFLEVYDIAFMGIYKPSISRVLEISGRDDALDVHEVEVNGVAMQKNASTLLFPDRMKSVEIKVLWPSYHQK